MIWESVRGAGGRGWGGGGSDLPLLCCYDNSVFLQSSTDRVVWSFGSADPTDPTGADAMRHTHQGSRSLNLLAGQPTINPATLDAPYLDFSVANVSQDTQLIVGSATT